MSSNSNSSVSATDGVSSGSTSTPVDASTAEQSVQANSQGSSTLDMNETVANVSELQQKAPQVWNAILQGIAQGMISQMQSDNDQLIQMMKQSQQENT